MPTNRDQVVEFARTWLGVPWRHQGRSRVHGVDCAGLIIVIGHEFEFTDFDITNYRREPERDAFIAHFRRELTEKNINDRTDGDIMLLRDQRFTCHAAILSHYKGEERMIHATAHRRKVVEELYDEKWIARTTQCFEFKGVID